MNKNEKDKQEGKEIRQERNDWTDMLTNMFDVTM